MSEFRNENMGVNENESYRGSTEIQVFHKRHPDDIGMLVLSLVERWGIVAADNDGEDTAGRAKLRLQTPEELVERACNTAEILFDELEKRGHLVKLPSPKQPTKMKGPLEARLKRGEKILEGMDEIEASRKGE